MLSDVVEAVHHGTEIARILQGSVENFSDRHLDDGDEALVQLEVLLGSGLLQSHE